MLLKTTGNDPYNIIPQLSTSLSLNNQKLHNNSSEKSQICPYAYCLCPYAYCLCPYAYCPNLTKSIRVMPTLIRVLRISSPHSYAYHLSHTRMLRVSIPYYAYQQRPFYVQNIIFFTHTRKASSIRVPALSYAYCLVPYAYDQKPELSDLLWLSLLRNLSDPTFHSPNYTK